MTCRRRSDRFANDELHSEHENGFNLNDIKFQENWGCDHCQTSNKVEDDKM